MIAYHRWSLKPTTADNQSSLPIQLSIWQPCCCLRLDHNVWNCLHEKSPLVLCMEWRMSDVHVSCMGILVPWERGQLFLCISKMTDTSWVKQIGLAECLHTNIPNTRRISCLSQTDMTLNKPSQKWTSDHQPRWTNWLKSKLQVQQ